MKWAECFMLYLYFCKDEIVYPFLADSIIERVYVLTNMFVEVSRRQARAFVCGLPLSKTPSCFFSRLRGGDRGYCISDPRTGVFCGFTCGHPRIFLSDCRPLACK